MAAEISGVWVWRALATVVEISQLKKRKEKVAAADDDKSAEKPEKKKKSKFADFNADAMTLNISVKRKKCVQSFVFQMVYLKMTQRDREREK